MKNGYYISAYANISSLGNLYMNGHRHDNCIALWKLQGNDVKLIHYWEMERISGLKHQRMSFFDRKQFMELIDRLVQPYGIRSEDIIEIWGIPELNESDRYLSKHRYPDFAYHAIAHLSSSIFSEMDIFRNENILAISADGGTDVTVDAYIKDSTEKRERDKSEFLIAYSEKGNIIGINRISSPAVLWGLLAVYYGVEEGTLMALAYASNSEYYPDVPMFEFFQNLGSNPQKSDEVMKFIKDVENLTNEDIGIKFNGYDPRFSERDNKISMVMKVVQKMSEESISKSIDEAIERYHFKPEDTYLSMAGGFALNCPCNTFLMKKYGFKGFLAVPCVNDSGIALGIGLYSFYNERGCNFNFSIKNAYHGDEDDLDAFLARGEFKKYIKCVEEFDPDQIVRDLYEAPVIWFDGKAEIGPRALGNRSIIGDPRRMEIKDALNKVKSRQWWRPVAPIMLFEKMEEWFEETMESPYMLQAIDVKEEKRSLIPAVVHMDGSARVQTVRESDEGVRIVDVLKAFYEKTGIPILCNTSLNDKGEPIINRIEEAINFGLRKGIKHAYINGRRITLNLDCDYNYDRPYKRSYNMPIWKDEKERKFMLHEYNPNNFSLLDILFYIVVCNIDIEDITPEVKSAIDSLKKDILSNSILEKQIKMLVLTTMKSLGEYVNENNGAK